MIRSEGQDKGDKRSSIIDGIRDYTGNRIRCQQLPALDPFQEIDSIESYVSFDEHQQYLMQKVFMLGMAKKRRKEKVLSLTLT